ncbi:DUF6233 domain-containing protein [Streptomyces lanatus]|uniref:DUF6233 domain-containing protein n=1 Tax=Streptomyces lanatus TaxID=66900 RepID=A0ABV1Y0C9_9ACTN|nr:DUF6233 domain-containing protein [Streptomyces lanatus]GHH22337.1 hypothetical protein GCM10018780_70700 [Streptomyces lanatus]
MPSTDPTPPEVRVILPDRQEVRGYLHERRQWPRGGWMYQVGIPVWANIEGEGIEAREYRVWLIPGEQVQPIDGVSYDQVPKYALPKEGTSEPDENRWGWKVQRIRPRDGRPGAVIMHVWDCPDAPAGDSEIDVHEALDFMRSTAGAVLCKECDAAIALGPLLPPS